MQDYFPQNQTAALKDEEVSLVLRNTYGLLALTFLFSAICAGIGVAINFPSIGLLTLLPFFLFLWLTEKNKNNGWGLVWVFALTGWLGLTLAPLLSFVTATKGPDILFMALGGTAMIFFALSGYVLTTKKDLSFMGGFLAVGITIAFVAAIANFFLNISGLGLAISSMFLLLSSGMIAWQTSAIIHGGETNYISATVTLFVSIYNIFVSLIQLIYSFVNE